MNMKNKYINPVIEIIEIKNDEIIRTSGGVKDIAFDPSDVLDKESINVY